MADSKPKAGRPTMLKDPERQAIIDCVLVGAPIRHAVMAAGVSKWAYYSWMRLGKRDRKAKKVTAFTKFLHDVETARAKFVTDGVSVIKEAAKKGSWQAQSWLLERQVPEEFADNRAEVRRMSKQIAELQATLIKIAANQGASNPVDQAAADK